MSVISKEMRVGVIGLAQAEIKVGTLGNVWFDGILVEVKALEHISIYQRVIVVEGPNLVLRADAVERPRKLTRTNESRNLASAALSRTTVLSTKFRLVAVLIHLSASVSPTITVTLDSKDGAGYDDVLDKQTLSSNTDYYFGGADGEVEFEVGDQIKVDITSVAATAGVTIITEELP